MALNPNSVEVSTGGEDLETVMGRPESEELPLISPGAFQVLGEQKEVASWQGVPSSLAGDLFPPERNGGENLGFWRDSLQKIRAFSNISCDHVRGRQSQKKVFSSPLSVTIF